MIIILNGNSKAVRKKHYNMQDFQTVLNILVQEEILPAKYKGHALRGDWQGFRECYIARDWLLIYQTVLPKDRNSYN